MHPTTDACQQAGRAAAGASLMRRATQLTIRKKLMLLFAALLFVGAGNVLIIQVSFARLQGTAHLVNLTGSLRWLSQSIQLDTLRLVQGMAAERMAIESRLKRLDDTLSVLEKGGELYGREVRALPPHLQDAIEATWRHSINYRQKIDRILAGTLSPRHVNAELELLYRDGQSILESADVIAATLATNAEQIEAEAMRNLYRLVMLDLALLLFSLLLIRFQVIQPLRRLVRASRAFASGRFDARVGFRSQDEIGEVALAFDQMAETIQQDMARIERDVAQLKSTEQSLRKMSRAIESSPATVIITDPQGKIEYVNPKFTEITGYTAIEAIGRTPRILKSGLTPAAVYRDLWSTIRTGREWRGELFNRKKNGELFWEDTRISSIRDEQGQITHFIAVKEDITARKAAEEKIVQLNADLEKRVAERTRQLAASNKELEAFSYSISHDLRAPLRGINGFAHLMEEQCQGCSKLESVDYLRRIRNASIRMGDLIDDLLDLSRLARSEVRLETVRISEMAGALLHDLATAEPERHVDVRIEAGLVARGDPVLLQAALQNLLGNAWKFTARQAHPRIEFGAREQDGEKVFYVRDNGAGFDMKYADKLFAAFQRLHKPEDFEGSGIGLATVKRIILLHGGRIWAESRVGEGATFYFTLPDHPETRKDASAP